MAIENTSTESIISLVKAQREFFHSGATLDVDFRLKQLKLLLAAMKRWEKPLCVSEWVTPPCLIVHI